VELVVGATGYVGNLLVRALLAERRPVRALARDLTRLPAPLALATASGALETVRGDLLTGEGLQEALAGCDAAYYLVHSMEPGEESFEVRDRRAAHNFVRACRLAGVARAVYLGGIAPLGGASPHMRSRLEVERILMDGLPAATALRASIVIGAHSPSFRLMVRLVERLRVLPLPPWRERRTQPVAEADVVRCLTRAPRLEQAAGRSIDVVGPDVLTYGLMLEGIAEALGIGRPVVALPISLTPITAAVAAAVGGVPVELVGALMGSLIVDVLPRSGRAAEELTELFSVDPLPFERAVSRALAEWEHEEPLAAR
jgi:uncharacterized protein YbjT (DUF2867 family)